MEAALVSSVVDVDGIGVHVVSAGLARRTAGEPIVIFESGGSASLQTWDSVLPAIARIAPILAYDRGAVDAFYHAALAAGGLDNGAPSLHREYHANYYGAFVLDPDGYNIEAVCHKAE